MPRGVLPILLSLIPLSAPAATFLSTDDFIVDWKISKQFTIAVADKMPAADYDFKASPEERSFGEQMIHISAALFERFSQVGRLESPRPGLPKTITKQIVIEWLNQSFDFAITVLPKLTDQQLAETTFKVDFEGRPSPEVDGREMLRNIFVHTAHHRAQCEVYLRLKGITPPTYTF